MKETRVGIIGIGQSEFKPRRDDANYTELVREGVTLALKNAGRELKDMEAVVYSLAPDALLGIGNAERLGVDAVGARNKRFMRINTGGATGISSVITGFTHIAAGVCDLVLVADVGGGTTDFTLIGVTGREGDLELTRLAVGEHILLGGDNMDLALAKAVEAKLPGGRLDAAQFGALAVLAAGGGVLAAVAAVLVRELSIRAEELEGQLRQALARLRPAQLRDRALGAGNAALHQPRERTRVRQLERLQLDPLARDAVAEEPIAVATFGRERNQLAGRHVECAREREAERAPLV